MLNLIEKCNGIERTKQLAMTHCQKAVDAISILKESEAQKELIKLTKDVVQRKK